MAHAGTVVVCCLLLGFGLCGAVQSPTTNTMQPFQAHMEQEQQQQRQHTDTTRLHPPQQPITQNSHHHREQQQQQQHVLLSPTDALAPPGGLPLSVAASLNPRLLFMAALADFAYVKDFGTSHARQDCGPCLQAWGAQGEPVVLDSQDAAGGMSHCTVFRTQYDLFLLFRGLDELSSMFHIEMDTAREYAADYFGLTNSTQHGTELSSIRPGSSNSSSRSGSTVRKGGVLHDADDEFFVLRGFLRAHKAIEPLYMAQLNRLAAQLAPHQRTKYRLWIIGHSDGSSLAQLAALRAAYSLGRGKLGGVVLFGAQRVGSSGFARHYNRVLGGQTLRVQYGWDPATEAQYLPLSGLHLVGRGYAVCPAAGRAVEHLVQVPLGTDTLLVCGEPGPGNAAAAAAATRSSSRAAATTSVGSLDDSAAAGSLLWRLARSAVLQAAEAAAVKPTACVHRDSNILSAGCNRSSTSSSSTGGSGVAAIPGAGSLYRHAAAAAGVAGTLRGQAGSSKAGNSGASGSNGVFGYKFLAHHMPAVFYDGLLRVLDSSGAVDSTTLAALQLPLCATSTKCAAALRQAPRRRCQTCGTVETCSEYWKLQAGPKCDDRHPLWSGYLCYSSYFAPGLVGLLGLFGSEQPRQQAVGQQMR